MKIYGFKLLLVVFFTSLASYGEAIDLDTFESISAAIKSKKNMVLQDESSLKVLPQYSQPQRKIQSTTEASESSLSTE